MEKVEKSAFLVAFVFFDTVVYSNLTTVKFLRSRSFGDLGQRSHVSCLSTFSTGFSSETTGQISFKFHRQSFNKGVKKVYIFRQGHMTKIAAMPIYNKNLKMFFSRTTELIILQLGM